MLLKDEELVFISFKVKLQLYFIADVEKNKFFLSAPVCGWWDIYNYMHRYWLS